MTPEEYASEYLQKHGMLPWHDFVPSTSVDKAARLYAKFVDDDLGLNPRPESQASDPNLPRFDEFHGEL